MNFEKVTKESYALELTDGAPKFTQENFKLINTFLKNDSNYNSVEDFSNIDFNNTYGGILMREKENFFNFKKIEDYPGGEEEYVAKDPLYLVISSIDKLNSTHLASQGQKGGNRGRIETAKKVYLIPNFRERLFNADPNLVNEIARFGGKNNFSFASKFCVYLCRYIFKDLPQENNYCIYDEVVQSVLPYFAYKYNVENYTDYYTTFLRKNKKQNLSSVKKLKNKSDYKSYIELVKVIVNKIKENSKIDITYEAFDHMLWYFFKGQPLKAQELMSKLPYKK